mgnify:CR=1 FL=1
MAHSFRTEERNTFLKTRPVRVGRISYMNVAPVYYGLNNGHKPSWMEMVSAPPSTLNAMLAAQELDVSPVSSAAYARHQDDWLLLPDLSISCFGEVMSVLLVSRRPLADLSGKRVILTRESATAAALTRYLLTSSGIAPRFDTGRIRCARDLPADSDAALVIGDAALKEKWRSCFDYVWDLGALWRERTGLPFVFALWAVRRSYAEARPERVRAVMNQFRRSRCEGERNIQGIRCEASARLGIQTETCRRYYDRLHYSLNALQIRGLHRFFAGLRREGLIPKPVTLSFFDEDSRLYAEGHAA